MPPRRSCSLSCWLSRRQQGGTRTPPFSFCAHLGALIHLLHSAGHIPAQHLRTARQRQCSFPVPTLRYAPRATARGKVPRRYPPAARHPTPSVSRSTLAATFCAGALLPAPHLGEGRGLVGPASHQQVHGVDAHARRLDQDLARAPAACVGRRGGQVRLQASSSPIRALLVQRGWLLPWVTWPGLGSVLAMPDAGSQLLHAQQTSSGPGSPGQARPWASPL